MKCEVYFTASRQNAWAVNLEEKKLGLTQLDRARVEYGEPSIKMEDVFDEIPSLKTSQVICLTEKEARECGHFAHNTTVSVHVAEGQLNSFVKEELNYEEDRRRPYRTYFVVDSDHVYAAWKFAGFPLEWNLEEKKTVPVEEPKKE